MNRILAVKVGVVAIAAWSLAVLPAGCRSQARDYGLHRVTVAQQHIHDIEPLQLKEADAEEPPAPDANEPPPEKMELSLEQCRALALENNLGLKAQLISPAIAAERVNEEEAKFESAFVGNVNFDKVDSPSVSFLNEITGNKVDNVREDLGVQMPLRTGGTVTFGFADSRTETNAEGTEFNPYYSSGLSASLSQPLLRNAGQWVNTHSIRIVAYERQISDARARLEVINVLAALDRVYWRLYAARKELEVREQQYALGQAQLEQARRFVDAGQRAQVEIVRAEAGVAQQLEAIIVAENSLRDRERELKRVIRKAGLDMQTPTVLVPQTPPDPVRYELQRPRLVRTAIKGRMELLELQLRILQDASTVDYARNQTLPLASLAYTYNVSGLGETRNDSYDLLFASDFADHRLGLQMVIPIGNEAAKSRLRQAMYQRRQRLATRADREDLIRLEVLNAADQVEANWQRILAARQNSILNGRLYEAERRQFAQGLRTSTEVLDAQTKFANAQSAEIRALAEYQIALVDMAYATGTLLGADKIRWEPVIPETNGN
ncbi:MAG: TolC family protein [Sedimentisphaerales bacterium]|nr:TolC family protein [Sedimentisphaerales bacterium]